MIEHHGKFPIFDSSRIGAYGLAGRRSKVALSDLASPSELAQARREFDSDELRAVVAAVNEARSKDRPVILMTGAHVIKNGYGPLLIDLIGRGHLTLVGVNAAAMIHDLELALVGRTSEDVPAALPAGEFGFAEETGSLINGAMTHGEKLKIGAGEALGRLILGEPFPEAVEFPQREVSLLAQGFARGAPVTIHASIGTDIVDQAPSFDPAAKGACSGRDFLIFCAEVEKMTAGGVYLNIGSAVTGPEVFLKACSMCANVGHPPKGIVTASFDIRPVRPGDLDDESSAGYYFRDIKSVVTRIPRAFGGRGYYVQGDHLKTIPALYQALVQS